MRTCWPIITANDPVVMRKPVLACIIVHFGILLIVGRGVCFHTWDHKSRMMGNNAISKDRLGPNYEKSYVYRPILTLVLLPSLIAISVLNLIGGANYEVIVLMVTKLTTEQREQLLSPLLQQKGWLVGDGVDNDRDAISKEFVFNDFIGAAGFMAQVALKAEGLNHHPEWYNVYNNVRIVWSTHDCSGLSTKDIQMAQFCDSIFSQTKGTE